MSPSMATVIAGLLSVVALLGLPVQPDDDAPDRPEHGIDILMMLPWV